MLTHFAGQLVTLKSRGEEKGLLQQPRRENSCFHSSDEGLFVRHTPGVAGNELIPLLATRTRSPMCASTGCARTSKTLPAGTSGAGKCRANPISGEGAFRKHERIKHFASATKKNKTKEWGKLLELILQHLQRGEVHNSQHGGVSHRQEMKLGDRVVREKKAYPPSSSIAQSFLARVKGRSAALGEGDLLGVVGARDVMLVHPLRRELPEYQQIALGRQLRH